MSIATKNFGGSCVVPLGRFRLFENLPFSLVSRGIRKTRDVVTFDLKKKKKRDVKREASPRLASFLNC